MNTRVLLVDDHEMMRDGLRLMLKRKPGIEVVGVAGDGQTAVELARSLTPDLIVMDIHLGDSNGIDVARRVLAEAPHIRIIILSGLPEEDFVHGAVQAGVKGYLLKANASEELSQAIQAVMEGHSYLCPEAAEVVLRSYRELLKDRPSLAKPLLSDREREVLRLTAQGLRVKEVAQHLNISPKTVETHRTHLMKKLDCAGVADLTRYAIREGLAPA